jgi:LysR family transcriptional regulator, nitrogen assimilation regulatory protein
MDYSVDLRELRALLVVGRAGSITGAARDLGTGQPDLSRLLQKLEEKLGFALLVRHGRGVRLTSAGALMAANADKILGLLREAAMEINASAETVRLLMIPPSLDSFVAPRIRYARAA